jgi:hypothetical protein
MGFSKPAQITGGEGIVAALRQQVAQVEALVNASVADEQEAFEERQQDRAAMDPRWAALAGDFGSWEDEEGNYAFGVPDEAPGAVQAGLLEYGGHDQAPVPLMRMGVLSDVADIGWSLQDRFRKAGH